VKRWILTILLFLLVVSGGAIVNVAVAWGCIAVAVPRNTEPETHDLGGADAAWPRRVPDQWPAPYRSVSRSHPGGGHISFLGGIFESQQRDVMVVRTAATRLDELDFELLTRRVDFRIDLFAAGWPLRCIGRECWSQSIFEEDSSGKRTLSFVGVGPPSQTAWRIGLPPPTACPGFKRQEDQWKRLPLRPLWLGFAMNTALYAIILWLLIPGPFVLRRLIRLRRGRCPKCGYDLRGAIPGAGGGCPECGWNREVEA
jgi:hypothetical protein